LSFWGIALTFCCYFFFGCVVVCRFGDQWSEGRPAGSMPLDQKRIRGLLSILTANVLEVDHQSATFQLVKAIVRTKIMCPEMYDLIDKLHNLTVSSYRKGIRDAAAQVLLFFMLEYPLGENRLAAHIK
jgi:U3 small nucleolar RNA-associated protein 20